MVGLYFSGTGNTKYCIETFLKLAGSNAISYPIEDANLALLNKHETIILAYPIYFSNLPLIMREFINENGWFFAKKKVYLIATMGLFSGDGCGVAARVLKKHDANVLGGVHLKMPDNISDVKLLKRSDAKNVAIIKKNNLKIKKAAKRFLAGKYNQEGLSFFNHLAGYFGQRLPAGFINKTSKRKPKIDQELCIGCSKCASVCPLANIAIIDNKAKPNNKCTLCYRCASICPQKAITIIGKKVITQYRIDKYIDQI